ncbi:hypothetical protein ACQU0X_27630 [Pseudovibrio ascidiaceicola]|uniref:hypothetical protein n=1 Tax=Pseudovibrio ascidiaceicola TaxID=285279 RepID=UPI003D3678D9
MTKYIKRISYDFDHYNEDDLFVTYDDKPFTGVLFCEEDGVLVGEESVVGGVRNGFALDYFSNKQVEGTQQVQSDCNIGIDSRWNENGELIFARKKWGGLTVEELSSEGGILVYEKKATNEEISRRLTSKVFNMYKYRSEPVYDLLAEAEEKIKNGTLFDDPRLYSEG